MKLEVGMFIRDTRDGKIYKLTDFGLEFRPQKTTYDFEKASHNIIDLIKAKDVLLIKDKQYDDIYKAEVVLDQDNNLSVINYDCDKLLNLQLELYKGDLIELVSVLTHEQFENNCFRIGD